MTAFVPIVVHHNPACGTSRNVLAIIEAAGYAPTIIPYLETGWTRSQLLALFVAARRSKSRARLAASAAAWALRCAWSGSARLVE